MSHPPGLVGSVYPKYFNLAAFGSLTNCFTFMTGFDDTFMEFLGIKALRPEDLGWTHLQTKAEWIKVVNDYFNQELPEPQPGSTAHRYSLHWTPPSVPAVCFPMIQGATDYHWAVYNGTYWLEQAGHGGPINVWASLDGMLLNVYNRGDSTAKYYVEDSHFFFSKKIA